MSMSEQARLAEAVERQRLVFAAFIFLIGLGSGTRALAFYFPRQEFAWMSLLHNAVGIAQVVGLLVMVGVIFQLRRRCHRLAPAARRQLLVDGFVERTNFIAFGVSWVLTFFLAAALAEWTEPEVMLYGAHDAAALFAPPYYFSLLICCMAVSYSLAFFALYLAGADRAEQDSP